MKIFSLLAVFSILVCSNAFGQASLVRNRLQAVALGKGEDVKRELPDLLAEFPEDPGVQFLHAVVLEDATRALKIYEKIVKDHPECEWADDSQWRIVQFYSLRKDTLRSRKELKVYREKYPQSEFLLNASEMVKATVGFPKIDKPAIASPELKSVATDVKSTPKPAIPESKTPAKPTTPADTKTASKPATPDTKTAVKPATPDTKTAVKPATPDAKTATKPTTPPPPDTKTATKPVAPETKTAVKTESKDTPKEVFSLQVGSYDTREAAENEVKSYKQKRLRASVTEKTIEGATKYAVFIGEYSSKESAEKAKELVQKSCKCTPFVVGK